MDIESPGNIERIRETFVLLGARLFSTQLLIGIVYFVVVDWFQLAGESVNFTRLLLFTALKSVQIVFSLYFFLQWIYRCYEITDKEVVCHSGVFSSKSDYYSLERLESAKLKQNFWGMMLGYGSIRLNFHHSDGRESVEIKNISHPRRHTREIEKNLRAHST